MKNCMFLQFLPKNQFLPIFYTQNDHFSILRACSHYDVIIRTRLPKFRFSAKFPIGLHVILQIQIRKFENDCYIM